MKNEKFIDANGRNQEVQWFESNLADFLGLFKDCHQSGTIHFLGFILPGGEILRLEVQVCGQDRHILRPTTVVVEGREVNGLHEHNVEEFRKFSEFGVFHTFCSPLDGNEPSC